ncbi:MAG TPA: hypothetical protein VGF56_04435 [Rhizomicrobium sp.]
MSNLLHRHEQPKAAVRPRMPSLFENDARHESPVAELTVETEAAASPSAASQQQTAIQAAAPSPQPSFAATVMQGPPHETAAQANPFVKTPRPIPAVELRVEREASAFAPPVHEAEQAPVRKPAQPHAEARQPVERHAEHHTHETELRIERETVLTTRRVVEQTQAQNPESPIPPAPRTAVTETKMPPPFAPSREERPLARETRRREAGETPASAAPETTIQISIGRIEIKASEEREKPSRKTDKPSSVMTLDEYLKSRARR